MLGVEAAERVAVDAVGGQRVPPGADSPARSELRIRHEDGAPLDTGAGAEWIGGQPVDQRLDLADFFGAALRTVVPEDDRTVLEIVDEVTRAEREVIGLERCPDAVVLAPARWVRRVHDLLALRDVPRRRGGAGESGDVAGARARNTPRSGIAGRVFSAIGTTRNQRRCRQGEQRARDIPGKPGRGSPAAWGAGN